MEKESVSLRDSQKVVEKETENVFADERIEAMFKKFGEVAKDGKLQKDRFTDVIIEIFDDKEDDRVKAIIKNKTILERMYTFLDTAKTGWISHQELAKGIGVMFSSKSENQMKFKFHVYNLEEKGYITPNDMYEIVSSVLNTNLDMMESKKKDKDLENFAKGRYFINGTEGQKKLKEVIGWAFDATTTEQENIITQKEFAISFKHNEELFDWNTVYETFMDELESKLEGLIN